MNVNPHDPASPVMHPDGTFAGIDIRTTIAMHVMSGVVQSEIHWNLSDSEVAEKVTQMADALIAELNKNPEVEKPEPPADFDSLVEQYNQAKINFSTLTSKLWKNGFDEGRIFQKNKST